MSFGYSVGDFAALLKIANDLRNSFAQAPKQYNAILNEYEMLQDPATNVTRNANRVSESTICPSFSTASLDSTMKSSKNNKTR